MNFINMTLSFLVVVSASSCSMLTRKPNSAANLCESKAKEVAQNEYSLSPDKVKYLGHDTDQEAVVYGVDANREFYLLDSETNLVVSFNRITKTGECKQSSSTFGPRMKLPQGFIAE